MAILEIVKYPASVLLKQTDPVTVFDDSLKQLARDLEETMYAAPGVGLAANQVGIAKRISVVNIFGPERRDGLIVLINPEIIRAEGEEEAEEGCLSIPGVWDKVNRATYVLVKTNTL
ncbi:MAG TPA: peptide deformylase, partial [bacterium]